MISNFSKRYPPTASAFLTGHNRSQQLLSDLAMSAAVTTVMGRSAVVIP